MAEFKTEIIGIEDFQRALVRNPQLIISESKKFIQRAIAKYKSGIINNPWKLGLGGGGAPVLTGNLRDTHLTNISNFEGRIYPSASYSKHVHKNRPWLDYVFSSKMPEIRDLEKDLLNVIVKDLAR